MPEHIKKYSRDELIIEAECIEECGEYLHVDLIGYSSDELRTFVEMCKN